MKKGFIEEKIIGFLQEAEAEMAPLRTGVDDAGRIRLSDRAIARSDRIRKAEFL